MDEIEKHVESICRAVGGSRSFRRQLREELVEHLHESVEAHMAQGRSREEAFAMATNDFGTPQRIEKDLESVHGRSILGLVAAEAMKWKEHNIKGGWKWSFAAMFFLAAMLLVQIAFAVLLVPKVVGTMQSIASSWGAPVSPSVDFARGLLRFLLRDSHFILIPLGALWILFEWRSRSDNKGVIRLFAGIVLCLFFSCANFVITGELIDGGYNLYRWINQEGYPAVVRRVPEISESYGEMRALVESEEWRLLPEATRTFRKKLAQLSSTGLGPVLVVSADRMDDAVAARGHLRGIDGLAERLERRAQPNIRSLEPAEVRAAFDELDAAWRQLERVIHRESG